MAGSKFCSPILGLLRSSRRGDGPCERAFSFLGAEYKAFQRYNQKSKLDQNR
jgi:hypothetical protein